MTDIVTWRFIMDYGPFFLITLFIAFVAGFAWLLRWIFRGNSPRQ